MNIYHVNQRQGTGVRVGIIDNEFGGLAAFEATNSMTVLLPSESGDPSRVELSQALGTHGTNVLEVIHGLAPRATLYACRYTDFPSFERCIEYMVNQRVDIINHSAGVPVLPLDGSNVWAQAVDDAVDANILWINSAGNFARGYLLDQFTDSDANNLHEFRGTGTRIEQELRVALMQPYNGNILLSWQSNNDTVVDLNLEVVDLFSGDLLGMSNILQAEDSRGSLFEVVQLRDIDTDFGIRIRSAQPVSGVVEIALFTEFLSLDGGTERGSVVAPADNPRVFTVGSLQGSQIAPYSSRGTLESDSLLPDLVTIGEIILASGELFVGTSAAAPVVAAAAALMREVSGLTDADQLGQALTTYAVQDGGIPGPDAAYGFGYLQMPTDRFAALPEPTLQARCELEVYANTNVRSGPGTNYPDLGNIPANGRVNVLGRFDGLDGYEWFFLGNGEWTRANTGDRVGDCFNIPRVNEVGDLLVGGGNGESCPGARPAVLAIGARAMQNLTEGEPVRMLDVPGGSVTQYLLYPNTVINVSDGPRCAILRDGTTGRWWYATTNQNQRGWVAEGNATRYFWEPLAP